MSPRAKRGRLPAKRPADAHTQTDEGGSRSGGPPPAGPRAFAGLIVRDREPENLEFPFSTLHSELTPNEQFFVRSHFPVPRIDLKDWKLKVEGRLERPVELTHEQLTQMPQRTVTMAMECAGNSRIFLSPKVSGLQWELGAVGNAEWTGVPLAEVLRLGGIQPGAVEVVLEGADSGEIKKEPLSPGKIAFARSVPIAKALRRRVSSARLAASPMPMKWPVRGARTSETGVMLPATASTSAKLAPHKMSKASLLFAA